MKAYLDIITDEIRVPKEGEYIKDSLGVTLANERHTKPYPIVVRQEIFVPDGAAKLRTDFATEGGIYFHSHNIVDIPRKKKKTKKTVWLLPFYRPFDGEWSYSVLETPEKGGIPVEFEVPT